VPVVEDMTVPFNFHGQLIGQKGKEIRQIMDECGVTVAVPKPEERSDIIQIIGPPSKIDGARKMIEKKLQNLEDERRQRVSIAEPFCACFCWVSKQWCWHSLHRFTTAFAKKVHIFNSLC